MRLSNVPGTSYSKTFLGFLVSRPCLILNLNVHSSVLLTEFAMTCKEWIVKEICFSFTTLFIEKKKQQQKTSRTRTPFCSVTKS